MRNKSCPRHEYASDGASLFLCVTLVDDANEKEVENISRAEEAEGGGGRSKGDCSRPTGGIPLLAGIDRDLPLRAYEYVLGHFPAANAHYAAWPWRLLMPISTQMGFPMHSYLGDIGWSRPDGLSPSPGTMGMLPGRTVSRILAYSPPTALTSTTSELPLIALISRAKPDAS